MPIYEYQCRGCCHCFEHLTLRVDETAPACPECNCADVEKLMSAGCVLSSSASASLNEAGQGGCLPSG